MPNSLQDLYFGKDDAETDISNGGLLARSFLETYAYKSAVAGRKSLIVGRKGSGKSAICLRIAQQEAGRATLITPDEISAEEIRRFELDGILPEQSKLLIWRYVFCIRLARHVLASCVQRGYSSQAVSELRKFLIDNGEAEDLSFQEKFWRVLEKVKASLSLQAFGVKVSGSFESGRPPGVRAENQLGFVEEKLHALIQASSVFTDEKPFYIVVDQVEKVWSNDASSEHLVIGVLLAKKHFATRPYLRCIVSLRTDIYDFIKFAERDKHRSDELRIDWSKEQIKNLLVERAASSLGERLPETVLFGQLFPTRVARVSVTDYLIDRTLMRPRDVIQFANACRDAAEKNGHVAIHISDVEEATVLYSRWKLSDVVNEWLINYPFLNDLLWLFSNSTYLVHRSFIGKSLDYVERTLRSRYPQHEKLLSLDGVLATLHLIGFLGIVRDDEVLYSYNHNGRVEARDDVFTVHPCFREALSCKPAKEAPASEPALKPEELEVRVSGGLGPHS